MKTKIFQALEPLDMHNQTLRANVHPEDYQNPVPSSRYNLVVIGAGTAGLVAASVAAGLGAKVALVERSLMGGDCLNTGCVPSKGLISSARVAALARKAGAQGVRVPDEPLVDFSKVMERMRKLRSDISRHDSVERFAAMGVDVFLGQARFLDGSSIEVDGRKLTFSKAVICTGARAAAPLIAGLEAIPYLTHETLFSLTQRPARLGVLGAGPVGAEMAQCFARFGSEVTLVTSDRGLLPREDREAAAVVQHAMEEEGVRFVAGTRGLQVSSSSGSRIRLRHDQPTKTFDIEVDQLLVAIGRAPNVEGLCLENAGVSYSGKGVHINDFFQTSNKRVYAAGDICSPYQFTHAADFMARSVVRNALFKGRARHSGLLIPWTTYTSPELAHVGLTPQSAQEQGVEIDTFTQAMSGVDRAVLEGETEGFLRVHVGRGTDRIVGATVVAAHAGELMGSIAMAMNKRLGLGAVANVIHPYPTHGEAFRKAGDLYNRTRLTPFLAKCFRKWLSWTR
jgi:pyruvate/2-oxoglutarate dehydrogenase complex dihydrolipoamide dehydrogenase (E3) component